MRQSNHFVPQTAHSRQIGRGPAVVCLHSSGSSSSQWRGLIARLARDHRVITPDFLGHGRSPQPEAPLGTVMAQDAAQVAAIAAASGGAHLIGHSYGAAVALRTALAHPDLVRSLVLYEPVVFGMLKWREDGAGLWHEITQAGQAMIQQLRGHRPRVAAQLFVDYWSGPGSWLAMGQGRQEAIAQRMPAVAGHFLSLFDWMPGAALRALPVPVFLMHGQRTRRVARSIVEALAEALPQVVQSGLGAAGHMGPITHAEAFIDAALRFLAPAQPVAPVFELAA